MVMPRLSGEYWSAADLDALPEDYRFEIVDGGLIAVPNPRAGHQQILVELIEALRPQVRNEQWSVVHGVDVILTADGLNTRRPDAVIYRRKRPDELLCAEDVIVAIEIVSASTATTDRVTKPVVYADAGIPSYWRVEQKPALSLIEYQLTELGKYYEHSPRAGVVKVDKPWPIEIDLDVVARNAGLV